MSSVFVDERDTFLAYSLKQASEAPFQNGCGESEPPVVVGVVGIGHVKGNFKENFSIIKVVDRAEGSLLSLVQYLF